MKVLIAEDDAVSRFVLRKSVEKLGHECVVTRDGLEAWEAYRNTPDVDVVISDWMMPGIEGPEFCRRVRGTDRPGYTFFIFLTALGGKEHLLEGMEAGADEYLTKPLDGDRLRAVLVSAARVTSLHRHLHAGSGQKAARPVPQERRTGGGRAAGVEKSGTCCCRRAGSPRSSSSGRWSRRETMAWTSERPWSL